MADSDLHGLLLSSQQPEWTRDGHQVMHSLRGLANGLHYLHNFQPLAKSTEDIERITQHSYHHDIKPRNILVKGTRLILADFGLARLKVVDKDTQTNWKNTPPTYGAPEAREWDTLQGRKIGRAYDIWSFGCIMSEFAAYSKGGVHTVMDFRKTRVMEGAHGLHNCFHHKGDMSSPVRTWLHEVQDALPSSSASWLCQLSLRLLKGNPDRRLESAQIVQEFNRSSLRSWTVIMSHMLESFETPNKLASVYLAKLRLEKNRLEAWATVLGLPTSSDQSQSQANQIFKDYDRLHRLLKICCEDLMGLQGQNHEPDAQQRVLVQLQQINDALLHGLPEAMQTTIENTFKASTISEYGTVQLLVESQQELSAPPTEDHEHRLLAAARHISHMMTSLPAESREGIKVLDPFLIVKRTQQPVHTSALSACWLHAGFRGRDKRPVLVEERSYDGTWTKDRDESGFAQKGQVILRRINELARLFQMYPKPKELRVLDCIGLYHSAPTTTFGYVYDIPSTDGSIKEELEPVSLDQIIQGTKDPLEHPTLNAKFALSQTIASCVYSLHLSGWLHKSISSSNIIFILNGSSGWQKTDLRDPYLVGFQHSRQSTPQTYSDGRESFVAHQALFVHPSYEKEGTRFHPAFDFYALGVVLLEIALWRPVHKMMQQQGLNHRAQDRLSEIASQYVAQRMGTGYLDVIMACLRFHDESQNEDHRAILTRFQKLLELLQANKLSGE